MDHQRSWKTSGPCSPRLAGESPPKLDKIRFAVGTEDGPRSSWWFVKVEDTGDVYMSARSLGGRMKLSLHRDGFCQLGYTDHQVKQTASTGLPPPTPKYMFRWQRPPSPTRGARHVASVIIPTDLLNRDPPPIPSRRRQRLLFPPALAGDALEFILFYSLEAARDLEKQFKQIAMPIAYCQFANGETVNFVVRQVSFDTVAFLKQQDWNKARFRPLSRAMGELEAGGSLTGLTAFISNNPYVDGRIHLVEASNLDLIKEVEN